MNIQSENDLDTPLNSHYPEEQELQGLRDHSPPAKLQHYEFKGLIFIEFMFYFIVQAILGPFGYFLVLRWLEDGKNLSRNLHVFGGKSEILRTAIWVMKVYCYATTFTFVPNFNYYEYDSMSQFWLLLYTDISLVVLSAAFYSSFTEREIERFRTEVCDEGGNVFKRLIAMIKYANTKVLDRTALSTAFPEIDQSNFYFVFPKSDEDSIPRDLAPESLQDAAPQFEGLGITNGVVVRGEKVASRIIEVTGYKRFELKISLLKFVSRLLILIRITLPVVSNVYLILTNANPFDGNHMGSFVIYLIQQGFYSYLIYRFVTVYDVIFLGLFLYKKKYSVLSRMGDIIAFKVKPNKPTQLELHICGSVPQNAHAWLNVRRILSSINEQVFLVVDTNMSFVLLYTFLFLALFFLQTMDLLSGLLNPAREFLEAKPSLLILLALTVFVVIIVLVIDVVIGIFINDLFAIERGQWMLHKQAAGNIEIKHEMYLDPSYQKLADKRDTRLRKLNEIHELLGPNFSDELYVYLRRLKNSIMLAIDGITGEENYNPHSLFGIPTNTTSVVAISTLASALGLTTIAQVFDILREQAQLK